jgi:hypothetical protein
MRRILLVAGLAAVVSSVICLNFGLRPEHTSTSGTSAAADEVVPETPYVIDVDRDQADVDIEFQPETRYVVILSSLTRGTGAFSVAASAKPIDTPRFVPRPLPPPPAVSESAQSSVSTDPTPGSLDATAVAAVPRDQPGPARSFALHVTDGSLDDPNQYAHVAAHEIAHSRNVRVYLDNQQSAQELAPGLVQSITELFDNELVPRFRDVFGAYRDIDGDGRFSVLLSPWLGRLQGGRTSIGGFVRGSDFRPEVPPPFSNHCDMMYVNSRSIPGPHLRTLLIHEYTHAVSFSRRTAGKAGTTDFPEEEDWLNEALAHCAESLFGGGWTNLDYRISRYLNETSAYPLVVEDYYRAGLWRCHGCRGATYLFLRYCVERFGMQTLARLIATRARGTGNLQIATGCPFDHLFRDWSLWLFENGRSGEIKASAGRKACGQLANLDLRGPLGEWGLAGPRCRRWDIDSGPSAVDLKATSTAFVEISASRRPGLRRIHFSGTRGMQLQASLVRLPRDEPQITIDAAWSRPTLTRERPGVDARINSPEADVLRVVVRASNGVQLAIEQVAAEQNIDEEHVPVCFRGDSLRAIEVSKAASPPNHEEFSRSFELPTQFTRIASPIVVKVVVADRQGRRASAWATVSERVPQQIAMSPARR